MIEEAALFELLSLECRVGSDGASRYYNSLGQLHREYGPAVVQTGGRQGWYQNGKLHRLDGPAFVNAAGYRAWFINDKMLTEAEWQQAVASMETV